MADNTVKENGEANLTIIFMNLLYFQGGFAQYPFSFVFVRFFLSCLHLYHKVFTFLSAFL